jgi:hypothetical protein
VDSVSACRRGVSFEAMSRASDDLSASRTVGAAILPCGRQAAVEVRIQAAAGAGPRHQLVVGGKLSLQATGLRPAHGGVLTWGVLAGDGIALRGDVHEHSLDVLGVRPGTVAVELLHRFEDGTARDVALIDVVEISLELDDGDA